MSRSSKVFAFRPSPFSTALAAGGALLVAAPLTANAAPYTGGAYEPFAYSTTDDPDDTTDAVIGGNTGGSGFATAWTSTYAPLAVTPGSLNYPGLISQGNRLNLNGANPNAQASRNVLPNGTFIDSGTVYFSFLVEKNVDSNRTINFALFNNTSERFSVGQYGTSSTNPATMSNGNFGVIYNNNGTVVAAANPVALAVDQTHLVVGRIDFNAGTNGTSERVRIYIDPTITGAGDEPLTAYLDDTSADIAGGFNAVRPFVGGSTTGNVLIAANADFDEIRVSPTFAGAVGIPEPTGLALLGLGLTATTRRGRRQLAE